MANIKDDHNAANKRRDNAAYSRNAYDLLGANERIDDVAHRSIVYVRTFLHLKNVIFGTLSVHKIIRARIICYLSKYCFLNLLCK